MGVKIINLDKTVTKRIPFRVVICMDNSKNKLYNIYKSCKGVMNLVPVTTPTRTDQELSYSSQNTAKILRQKRGVRTLTGKRLVELSKEDK